VWESKLQEQRILVEERSLQECTFQPNSMRRNDSSERCLRDTQTPRTHSEPSQGRHAIPLSGVPLSEERAYHSVPQNGERRKVSNPVTQIIHSMDSARLESARDTAFMEGVFQIISPDSVSFDTCQKQIREAERTVAQCRSLLDACA
jgi:hypothetical protein